MGPPGWFSGVLHFMSPFIAIRARFMEAIRQTSIVETVRLDAFLVRSHEQ